MEAGATCPEYRGRLLSRPDRHQPSAIVLVCFPDAEPRVTNSGFGIGRVGTAFYYITVKRSWSGHVQIKDTAKG